MSKYDEFIAGGDWGWDKEEVLTDDSDVKTHFGKMRAFIGVKVKRFQKGEFVEFPGVLNYPFDESTQTSQAPTGPYRRNGMAIGKSSDYLHLIMAELKDKDGNTYQRKIISFSWIEYEGLEDGSKGPARPNIWNDYVKNELLKLSQPERLRLSNTGKIAFDDADNPESWVYAKFDLALTNYTYQYDPKRYFANIVIYDNQQEMEKAEREWRAQFSDGAPQPQDYSHYPQIWQSKPEQLAKFAKKQSEAGKSYKEIAVACKLFDDDGNPVDSANGSKVNVVTLLSELLDVPEPVVTL